MNPERQITRAYEYMSAFHKNDTTGHDIAHVSRVVKLATHIASLEQPADYFIIKMAALLHDTVDTKLTNATTAKNKLQAFLSEIGVSSRDATHICFIIAHMSFKNGQNNDITLSKEGQIVRDADRLDAIGAIGIARTFQFAGHFNEAMWSGDVTLEALEQNEVSLDQLSQSAIKHFYEKLFTLKSLMHTNSAKAIAQQRHQFMELYIQQFFAEWNFQYETEI
ncbi:HD domain-containing protein [Staphylococcus arlettae]|uniref:HD domain-containing protein n=1 Tax=Staphylococcus arlettae TaxID=29378 RepID=UPI001133409D|nr:HD domain-containing protein [Staphylococcus arlettae]MCD9055461.1 HD domain-containing protein [Staphylococcus arlettae]BBK27676.1 phosphohydrolase [Staphylococcus arlettae]